ncbi:substrate-binding and VWA domain-containing protein [Sphaerisporangium sp. NPDC005288]|uniref:substrate-binding and VWA domain-containing protein n=1 Tax=Sphaerisporangium sp. NPDC005288 TaxID=3155114 RepID=UPI0033BA950D
MAGLSRRFRFSGAVAAVLAASALIPFSGGLTTKPQGTGCVGDTRIPVIASIDKIDAMRRMAQEFTGPHGHEVDGRRVCLDVLESQSGSVLLKLIEAWRRHDMPGAVDTPGPFDDYPLIWLPASTMWWVQLKERTDSCGSKQTAFTCTDNQLGLENTAPRSLARSPMVVAVPRSHRDKLSKLSGDTITWKALTTCYPTGCDPALGKTNPNLSTMGLAAELGMIWEAAGDRPNEGAAQMIYDVVRDKDDGTPDSRILDLRKRARDGVRRMEMAFTHYGATTNDLLCELTRESADGKVRQAVVVDEQTVWSYNTGRQVGLGCRSATKGEEPQDPLSPIFLADRSLMSDHPFVLIDPEPKLHEVENRAARDFRDHLLQPEQQREFQDFGFRIPDQETGKYVLGGPQIKKLYPDRSVYDRVLEGYHLRLPPCVTADDHCPRGVFDDALTVWATELRKPLRTEVLVDYSGSMSDPVRDTGAIKIDIALAGVAQMLAAFHEGDRLGVRVFATLHPEKGRDWEDIRPFSPVTSKNTVAEVRAAFQRFFTVRHGGERRRTGLYDSIADAVEKVADGCTGGETGTVVVLTDGANAKDGGRELDRLVNELSHPVNGRCAVRVMLVAYGGDIDDKAAEAMARIADATSGGVYYATDPASLGTVLTDLIADF